MMKELKIPTSMAFLSRLEKWKKRGKEKRRSPSKRRNEDQMGFWLASMENFQKLKGNIMNGLLGLKWVKLDFNGSDHNTKFEDNNMLYSMQPKSHKN